MEVGRNGQLGQNVVAHAVGDSVHEQGTVIIPPQLGTAMTALDTIVKIDNVTRSTVQVSMLVHRRPFKKNHVARFQCIEKAHSLLQKSNKGFVEWPKTISTEYKYFYISSREFKIRQEYLQLTKLKFSLQLMGSGPAGKSGQIAQYRVHMASDHVSGHVTTPYQGTADMTAQETPTRYKRATSKNVQVLPCFTNSIIVLWITRFKYYRVRKNISVVFKLL